MARIPDHEGPWLEAILDRRHRVTKKSDTWEYRVKYFGQPARAAVWVEQSKLDKHYKEDVDKFNRQFGDISTRKRKRQRQLATTRQKADNTRPDARKRKLLGGQRDGYRLGRRPAEPAGRLLTRSSQVVTGRMRHLGEADKVDRVREANKATTLREPSPTRPLDYLAANDRHSLKREGACGAHRAPGQATHRPTPGGTRNRRLLQYPMGC
jgi:hypothetical protein